MQVVHFAWMRLVKFTGGLCWIVIAVKRAWQVVPFVGTRPIVGRMLTLLEMRAGHLRAGGCEPEQLR